MHDFCLYNKKKITRWLEDMNFIFSWLKQYFTHSLRSFVNLALPLENKIHILAPPCNILYVCMYVCMYVCLCVCVCVCVCVCMYVLCM